MTQTLTASSKARFYFIDALRGLAAFWVVLFHAHLDERLDSLEQRLPFWLDAVLFARGSLGVAIFFVLSGFVIAHSLRNATIDFPYLRQFTLRRLIRLTPPYYISIVITLIFALLAAAAKNQPFQPMGQLFSVERFIAHLFYVQELVGFINFNDVYWTLGLEIQSYLLFCLLIGLAQRLLYQYQVRSAFTIVFLPVALIAAIFPIAIAPGLGRSIVILPLLYSFLLGIFAYWCWQRRVSRLWFYLYSGILIVAGVIHQAEFTIASVAIAVLLLEVGRAGRLTDLLKGPVLQFFGEVSYSLFLTHTPVMGVVFFIGQRILRTSAVSDVVCLVFSILVCLGVAKIVWIGVEKPAIEWSRSIKLPTTVKAA